MFFFKKNLEESIKINVIKKKQILKKNDLKKKKLLKEINHKKKQKTLKKLKDKFHVKINPKKKIKNFNISK